MDLSIVIRLEEKIDQLLARKQELEEECRRLTNENTALLREKEEFGAELDRILAKLDRLGQEIS
ncbi:MAG: cell division protein ZapB [Syntrophotaleaceae bacterium]